MLILVIYEENFIKYVWTEIDADNAEFSRGFQSRGAPNQGWFKSRDHNTDLLSSK